MDCMAMQMLQFEISVTSRALIVPQADTTFIPRKTLSMTARNVKQGSGQHSLVLLGTRRAVRVFLADTERTREPPSTPRVSSA